MTPELWVALLIGVAPTIGAIFIAVDARAAAARSLVVSKANSSALAELHTTVQTVAKQTDGVLEKVAAMAEAKGVAAGAAAVVAAGASQERDHPSV